MNLMTRRLGSLGVLMWHQPQYIAMHEISFAIYRAHALCMSINHCSLNRLRGTKFHGNRVAIPGLIRFAIYGPFTSLV